MISLFEQELLFIAFESFIPSPARDCVAIREISFVSC
jgi:hypothetical protein